MMYLLYSDCSVYIGLSIAVSAAYSIIHPSRDHPQGHSPLIQGSSD